MRPKPSKMECVMRVLYERHYTMTFCSLGLEDIYNAENRIRNSLPKLMIKRRSTCCGKSIPCR
jgi:hypothetical protein